MKIAIDQMASRVASYQDVALEYYDDSRHPTCRDLRTLSAKFLIPHLRAGLPSKESLVEVGPGLSILAPEAEAVGGLSRVILVDSSPKMLSYSTPWVARGARSLVASADATGLPSGTVSLVVSSLGDPYNHAEFWREIARLLKPGGTCLFTMPSFQWSSIFRSDSERDFAEFERADGVRLFMPSHVRREEEQVRMIEAAGLLVEYRTEFGTEMLETEPAPKLRCVEPSIPVISAYSIRAVR